MVWPVRRMLIVGTSTMSTVVQPNRWFSKCSKKSVLKSGHNYIGLTYVDFQIFLGLILGNILSILSVLPVSDHTGLADFSSSNFLQMKLGRQDKKFLSFVSKRKLTIYSFSTIAGDFVFKKSQICKYLNSDKYYLKRLV